MKNGDFSQNNCRYTGNEIVISGMSGIFPKAENTLQLSKNLYGKIDMVTQNDEYAQIKRPDAPKFSGNIQKMEKFDNQFFRVTHWQASTLDAVARKLMEEAFSAFFDAGVNPETLRGTKLGVFIGSMQSDCGNVALYDPFHHNAFIISGCSKSMLANRISYWLDAKGPSFGFDSGCTGSMAALEMAYDRIKNGEIDCALVGGTNFCMHPTVSVNMKSAGLICLDGKTKCFDKHGDGYVRSDAISLLFLQQAKDAKRIYSEIYHVKGKYFASPDNLFLPTRNPKDLEKFMEEFYSEIDVSPDDVEFIEANAYGIAEADGNELEAIGNVFCKDKPIKIGSIKSNMGNSEGASGACSVIKMCLAYQSGRIPANLHYNEPQNHIAAVKEGRLQVVTEHTRFDRKFTAINNFCYTGSNFHALLKGHYKPKDLERYKSSIPRLLLVSGRQEESVNKILDILETNPIDPEQYALLNNIFKYKVTGHTGRGYTMLDTNNKKETYSLSRGFEFYSGNTRPVWFLYSGMGSQWAGMGEDLLRLPVFAAAIERCHKALLPKGFDIVKIITDKDSNTLNIVNSFLAITAIQIGLTDVLKSIGIVPDNIIGHSVGELGSAYADEALTAEQTILASYSRAIVSYETEFIKGKMAAVGIGYEKVSELCPPEVQVACHNSSESATISGPADIVEEFVKSLTDQGIFAREVASSNIAFHSKYIAKAGPDMLALQKQFITEPKLRSKKWLSTCYSPKDWDKAESKYASAEYFTHNLLNAVLFEEAANLIPNDAIILEIAPHGLLQAIMKRSHSQCINLSLTRRGERDGVKLLLESIGKLYQNGLDPDVDALYPKVEFPVSTATPVLSNVVAWDHSADWPIDKFILKNNKKTTSKEFIFSIYDDDYRFLNDRVQNGVNVLPEAALLVFVWETLAGYNGVDYRKQAVVFDHIKFYNEIVIKPEKSLRLIVTIERGSSRFEVTHKNNTVVEGFVKLTQKVNKKCGQIMFPDEEKHLNQSDIYTLLRVRGYAYEREFQSIKSTNIERNRATIKWNDEWITFLDSMIQFNALSNDHDGVSTVKLINNLTININENHKYRCTATDGDQFYNAVVLKDIGDTKCGGVTIHDIIYSEISKPEIIQQNLQTYKFIPHTPTYDVDLQAALQINLQVVFENISSDVIKIKVIMSDKELMLSNKLKDIANKIPLSNIDIDTIDTNRFNRYDHIDKSKEKPTDLLIFQNFLEDLALAEDLVNNISENTFIMTIEEGIIEEPAIKIYLQVITVMHVSNQSVILMKKPKLHYLNNMSIITTPVHDESYLQKLRREHDADKNIILVVETKPELNIQGIVKEVKRNEKISLFIIDATSPKFKIANNYYKEQFQKGLKINIHNNGRWGSFSYTPASAQYNTAQHFKLVATEQSNVDSLTWTETPIKSNKQTIQVCYSGLSTKDCKRLYEIQDNNNFGMDFSGTDERGQRVMGLLPRGAMASTVEADYDLLWPVPEHWSLAEAATVPLPYAHAFYCLAIIRSLRRNGTVLITGAAGALGQAATAVALSLGCTVFASVRNADKKRFLLNLFPELDENNIGYTYDVTFRDMVVTRTKNERCDIVINCASGKIRQAAMGCVGFNNYFLDINDSDQKANEQFTFSYLWEAKSYRSVNMSSIFIGNSCRTKKKIKAMISDGIAKGFVRPLTSVVFTPSDISRAFRLLSNRSNRGRVLIKIEDSATLRNSFSVIPRVTLSSSKTYIVVSDGTELSIELIDRLVQRGARRIWIHCNPKLMSGYFHVRYAAWRKLGVNIEYCSEDLQIETSCQNLVRNINKLGSIDGIFITHNYLTQRKLKQIEPDNINTALIVSNLDLASRKGIALRYFAVIIATSRSVSNEHAIQEMENCCSLRRDVGAPSLFLRHIMNDEKLQPPSLSLLFNAMESSLKLKYISVLTSDSMIGNIDKSELNSRSLPNTNTNFNGGLQAFFSHILEDEFAATEPIVQMKTKVDSGDEHELLVNPEESCLIMIPGIGGSYKTLTSLSERLKKPAIALQLGPSVDGNIQEMAKQMLSYIKMRMHLKSPFYIMGYSFGVNVALELAHLLEKEGLVGVVYCLDSSPDAMRVHLNAYLGNMTEEQLQNSLVEHMFKLLAGHESRDLKEILQETTSWSDKIEVFINKIKNHVSHTHQYLKAVLDVAYNRIKMAEEYKPKYKLESELVLIKGVPHPNADQLNNDYSLSMYTNKPIQVYDIQSDHALAPLDLKVANYMNKTLL